MGSVARQSHKHHGLVPAGRTWGHGEEKLPLERLSASHRLKGAWKRAPCWGQPPQYRTEQNGSEGKESRIAHLSQCGSSVSTPAWRYKPISWALSKVKILMHGHGVEYRLRSLSFLPHKHHSLMLPIVNHTFKRPGSKWSGLRIGCDAENPATFLPRTNKPQCHAWGLQIEEKCRKKHRRWGPHSKRWCFSPSPHIWIDQGYNGVRCVAPMFTSEDTTVSTDRTLSWN